jgi:cytochrome c oxidase assembly protein subunit 20
MTAADTRDESKPANSPKTYTSFAPENANALPVGSVNTAGGRTPDAGIAEIVKSITLEDFRTVHTKPCVRDSLLMGILGGFGVGGVRAILGGTNVLSV